MAHDGRSVEQARIELGQERCQHGWADQSLFKLGGRSGRIIKIGAVAFKIKNGQCFGKYLNEQQIRVISGMVQTGLDVLGTQKRTVGPPTSGFDQKWFAIGIERRSSQVFTSDQMKENEYFLFF